EDPLLAVGTAETVAGDQLLAGLRHDDAVDADGPGAHEVLGLAAGVGQPDHLDGLGQRDKIAVQGEWRHGIHHIRLAQSDLRLVPSLFLSYARLHTLAVRPSPVGRNRKGIAMRRIAMRWLLVLAALTLVPGSAGAACCYFSAQNADILQPAQKVFLTW